MHEAEDRLGQPPCNGGQILRAHDRERYRGEDGKMGEAPWCVRLGFFSEVINDL
jgi:hypothetical protein